MGDILFLAHRIPFPPDRGDKIRSHHLLKALAAMQPVHVACFGETDADMAAESELTEIAKSHCLVRRTKPLPLAGLEALGSGKPVSLTAFESAALRSWIGTCLAKHEIDTIFVFSGQMGQYVPADFAGRVVVDLCDVDSAKFEAYGIEGSWPRKVIDRREGKVLAREEERLAHRADETILISENEANLFRSRLIVPAGTSICAIRNGIDADLFDPRKVEPHSKLFTASGPQLVFTGQMDYPPNIVAAERVIHKILPAIRKHHPDAKFHIVGRAPVAKLLDHDGQDGIRVWGAVPDVKPFLAAADLVIAPLTIARGIQNKVLEAMAMARPVLLSPEAATGIDAQDSVHFAVADGDPMMIGRALTLIDERDEAAEMARAAREYVLARQSWPAMLAPLEAIMRRPEAKRDAA
ncbi:TIGR03087 family PEP-CTERM/XrtA system glycosyltransferase [Parerythrobacter jejuensis]|uniref:TIGR03087 family PEP-CTERM/XrtA system glycosyltransferase n=1 Tax=Parerythrobacter jejuensis TaxID=795812 RepID=A0A845ANU8_9SPHN|nr:TIGR03087 family PEP-CTERM/XrtA system glycosyltransferase [Parerythrobacter jejuensis]MXP32492.1 TIGR03087 family PEP-CTERM/XrtA system glycosyltransferase [Parerythrobacter jejuensis]